MGLLPRVQVLAQGRRLQVALRLGPLQLAGRQPGHPPLVGPLLQAELPGLLRPVGPHPQVAPLHLPTIILFYNTLNLYKIYIMLP